MKRLVLLVLVTLALVVAWWSRHGPVSRPVVRPAADALGSVSGAPMAEIEVVLARARAAGHFERGEFAQARAELAPLVAADDAALEDLVRAAAVEYMDREHGAPEPLFERIRARDAEEPALLYMQARRRLEDGDFEGARACLVAVHRRRPEDLATRAVLGATLADLGQTAPAREILGTVVAEGVEHAGGWYVLAIHRLAQLAQQSGLAEEAQRLLELQRQLSDLGYRAPGAVELELGTLELLGAPRARGVEGAQPGRLPRFVAEPAILPELADAHELFALDLEGAGGELGGTDFLAAGPTGVRAAFHGPDGYRLERVLSGPVEHVRAFDLGNNDTLDLIVSRGPELVLLEHASGAELLFDPGTSRWRPAPLALPRLPAPPADLALVDFDHDGDLDLLLVGPFGARLLRNDGAAPRADGHGGFTRGAFVDASVEAGLPRDVALTWCATEDHDNDHDVDLWLGGPESVFLMDNLRAGRFVDVAARVFGAARAPTRRPVIADFDGDARPDLFEPGAPARLWRQRSDGALVPEATPYRVPDEAAPFELDLDLDGTLDVVWASPDAIVEGVLGLGLAVARADALAGGPALGAPLVSADFDRDLDLDLARLTAQGLEILRCEGPVGRAARLAPIGLKDNRRALGAVLEARTRGLYRRIWWRGEAQLVACGPYPSIDVVRITWPNGAVQTRLDVPPTDQALVDADPGRLEQPEGLIGSCPFLYSWNGGTFEFVSDVLGGTPLGLPMGPGMLVPPDHDEYVLVRGDQLVPRDGRLELQLTEELREVTYLDRIRLDVVDHPAGSSVYPNERFTFPPFPEPHLHTVVAPLAPLAATGSDGRDWTAALAAVDDVHAQPFEPLESQLLGLATPHWLELEFEPARLRAAARLRLVCTGWFYWTDASVNMASARTPGVRFVPPTLQVLDPEGGWRDVGPPLGFPAGKSKTMVIELDALAPELRTAERPRLRLFSSLRLYWDSIQLAVDADDAPRRVTALEPESARLWPRGFSRPLPPGRGDLPERFDWDSLAERPRWNPHPGLYTRHGETLPLLGDIDDRFVILGSGDALHVTFDARALAPPPEGWVRDYLVFLDGWAKDRDPNTLAALEVEPLPFHGMSGYPYGPDERFPDGEAHRAWRAEWNTRAEQPWIPPLAPAREAEWAVELVLGR